MGTQVSFQRTLAPTGGEADGQDEVRCPQRGDRQTGPVEAASGADGADPECLPVTEEVHSEAVAPGRLARSATGEGAVWVAVASEVAEAASEEVAGAGEAGAGEAGAGGDRSEKEE